MDRRCKFCDEPFEFEPAHPREEFCPDHRRRAFASEIETSHVRRRNVPMAAQAFPEEQFAEVRRRIVEHNHEPSTAIMVRRIKSVGEAARARDVAAVRAALADLAAVATRMAAHPEPLRVLGTEAAPVVPHRRGRLGGPPPEAMASQADTLSKRSRLGEVHISGSA